MIPDNIDRELVIDRILDYCEMHEPLYLDPDVLKLKTERFFSRYYNDFYRMEKAFEMEYNPIHNYDRYEKGTNTDDTKSNTKASGDNSDHGNSENKVSAYDSDIYEPNSYSNTNGDSNFRNNSDTTVDNDRTHDWHIYGNIGVTTTQEMLKSEAEVRPELNIYDIIARMYYNEFMLMVI